MSGLAYSGGKRGVGVTADDGGFGALLGAARRAAGFSQRQLAELAGVSVAAIRDLEQRRTRRPQRRFVDALVAALALTGDAAAAFHRAALDAERIEPASPVDPGQ